MNHEEPTNELRQVWTEAWRQCSDGKTISYFGYYTVQQKWLVRDGDNYVAMKPRSPYDICIIWVSRGDESGWQYRPMKAEWRDLLTVDEKDVK